MKKDAIAYIALGSNLGDREQHIKAAIESLRATPQIQVVAVSDIFETPPFGPIDQGPFLNAAAKLKTPLLARELLSHCLRIEAAQGRTRDPVQRWGPRTLDIDLLLYGDLAIDEPGLQLPHP